MKSVTERVYLTDFILACLAYCLFVGSDSIVKYLGSDYSIVQIIFVNSWFALIPIVLYTQTLNGWRKLKKANFTVHFFRALTMALALFFGYTGFYRLPMVTMYSIVFLIPLMITIGSVFFLKPLENHPKRVSKHVILKPRVADSNIWAVTRGCRKSPWSQATDFG